MSGRAAPPRLLAALVLLSGALLLLGGAVGSMGWEPPWRAGSEIVWQIRLPRSLGAWLAGALLGLAGAIAQGLFRNPLADPFLLGSASGAHLGVALLLALLGLSPEAAGWLAQLGMTGAAFAGAALAVLATLALARGVQHTLRLLLAGVVVGMVLGAVSSIVMLIAPHIMRSMQAFMLGTTGLLGWDGVRLMALALAAALLAALPMARTLDALGLGEDTAQSLGAPLPQARVALVAAMALATGAAVAQAGLIAFVGLVAPHLVRAPARPAHRWLLLLSALMGGALLLASDVLGRWLLAPREVPVGIVTAILGGGYLLMLMQAQMGRRT